MLQFVSKRASMRRADEREEGRGGVLAAPAHFPAKAIVGDSVRGVILISRGPY